MKSSLALDKSDLQGGTRIFYLHVDSGCKNKIKLTKDPIDPEFDTYNLRNSYLGTHSTLWINNFFCNVFAYEKNKLTLFLKTEKCVSCSQTLIITATVSIKLSANEKVTLVVEGVSCLYVILRTHCYIKDSFCSSLLPR